MSLFTQEIFIVSYDPGTILMNKRVSAFMELTILGERNKKNRRTKTENTFREIVFSKLNFMNLLKVKFSR